MANTYNFEDVKLEEKTEKPECKLAVMTPNTLEPASDRNPPACAEKLLVYF